MGNAIKKSVTRGTTPTHIFTTDADLSLAAVLYITYKQKGHTIIEKTIEDVSFDEGDSGENVMTVTLTQEDTLKLIDGLPVRIQVRAGFEDGSRIASNIIEADAGEILKEGEI